MSANKGDSIPVKPSIKPVPKQAKKMKVPKFNFQSPPEAPIFKPTEEEFQDPLTFINKIRPVAEKYGICKIIPPPHWKPPFSLDFDKFKFTPRIQRINELEAKTRIKLNFRDEIAKFWALKGAPLKIPSIGKTPIDLYSLHKLVKVKGGPEQVSRERKWNRIAFKMGYPGKGSVIRGHYDHLIYPYYLFRKELKDSKLAKECDTAKDRSANDKPNINSGSNVISSESGKYKKKSKPRELKSLQFLGPGPKMAVGRDTQSRTRGKKVLYNFDPLAKYICKNCSNDEEEEALVTCERCEDKYHLSCVEPPLEVVVEAWKCPKCVAAEVCKPLEDFGFAQAESEYTLKQFQDMANEFKTNYFKVQQPNAVTPQQLETEFWRIVSSLDESVTVEYGADLHSMDHGSGFPTRNSLGDGASDIERVRKYVESKWNLNNFPVLKASTLRHISADISGMKIPWVYVGMCFATFCWHNEDHWSYSINYLHMGEPKTWYGVPGNRAEDFETAMKLAAPELFQFQPDLLHQLVTIMNPNVLMKAGIPICRTDQNEGEFVVTFPRAYHAGFNQGFNVAEACNFTPCDWLSMGRECIDHYASLRRFCVFSHDELICKMAEICTDLDDNTLVATFKDFHTMLMCEKRQRKELIDIGVTKAEREKFDELADDERQCVICKTTCFLSALHCTCDTSKLVCLNHISNLCSCSPTNYTLKYQYRLDELVEMYISVKSKAEKFDNWIERVNNSFTRKAKLNLRNFCELLAEAKEKDFPRTDFIEYFEYTVRLCIEYSSVARTLVNKVLSKDASSKRNKPTLEDLSMFLEQMEALPCVITETSSVRNLLCSAKRFKQLASKLISSKCLSKRRLEACINMGFTLNMELEELPLLKEKYKMADWCEKCKEFMANRDFSKFEELKDLLDSVPKEEGFPDVERFKHELTNLLMFTENWQKDVCSALSSSPPLSLEELESLLKEGDNIRIHVPEREKLSHTIQEIKAWIEKANLILEGNCILPMDELNKFIIEGSKMSVDLPLLTKLETNMKDSTAWILSASDLFVEEGTKLIETLWPRKFRARNYYFSKSVKLFDKPIGIDLDQSSSPAAYQKASCVEMSSLMALRLKNFERRTLMLVNSSLCACGVDKEEETQVCVVCQTIYHKSCLMKTIKMGFYGLPPKFVCYYCQRSKRPSLEAIGALAKSGETLTIKTMEYKVFKCYVERVNEWLKKAHNILNELEMKCGISIIKDNINTRVSNISVDLPKNWMSNAPLFMKPKVTESSSSPQGCDKMVETPTSLKPRPSEFRECGVKSNIQPNWGNIYRDVEISGTGRLELRQCMMEGDLLEISVHETSQMWILLQATMLEFKWQYMSKEECASPAIPPLKKSKPRGPRKKSLDAPPVQNNRTTPEVTPVQYKKKNSDISLSQNKRKSVDSATPPSNKKREVEAIKTTPVKTTKAAEMKPLKRRKKTTTNAGPGSKKVKTQQSKTVSEVDLEAETAEECAASNCLKPSDVEVDWVQCDGRCGLWFHMRCVDLSKQDITEEDEYICVQCTGQAADEVEISLDQVKSFAPPLPMEVDPLL